jgi:heat shock protein HslJ
MRPLLLAALVVVAACGGQSADKTVPSADALPPGQKAGGELLPQGAPATQPELVDMDTSSSTDRAIPGADADAAAPGSLTGTTWEWVYTQTPVERIAPDDPSKYTLEFAADGKVTGAADCNRLMGTYKADGKALEFSPLATTRKMCPPGGRGDWYAKSLGFVRNHFFTGDTLRMDMMADGGTFAFRRKP